MNNTFEFTLNDETTTKLASYGELLNKDKMTMVYEALEQYFEAKDEEFAQKDPMTNLSYDEFWDDIDLDE